MKKSLLTNAAAGILMYIASIIVLLGIITAESFYPSGYSTRLNEISDLGATRPPHSVSFQPSSALFNTSMIVSGILIVLSAYLLLRNKYHQATAIVTGIFGAGVLAVGLFPGNTGNPHVISAMLTFLAGGAAAVVSSRSTDWPFNALSLALGVTALVFWFGAAKFIPILGMGGTERWIAYPIILWLAGFGGFLAGRRRRAVQYV